MRPDLPRLLSTCNNRDEASLDDVSTGSQSGPLRLPLCQFSWDFEEWKRPLEV